MRTTHPGIRAALEAAAEELSPKGRPRPSAWAAASLSLSERESMERPGPIDLRYLPWTAAIMDLRHDRPDKFGAVIRKRSQVGVSISMMAMLAYEAAHLGGPILYAIHDHREAANIADQRIVPLLMSCASLAQGLGRASEDERRLLTEVPFAGGRLDVVGGGSASKFSSRPYRIGILDEWANIIANFPATRFGDAHAFIVGRFGSFSADTFRVFLGHPTVAGRDIDELYSQQSDLGAWVFDCPHCGHTIAPRWHDHVVFLERDPLGDEDPESAVFVCDGCGAEISDQQRRDAVWPAAAGIGEQASGIGDASGSGDDAQAAGDHASPLMPDARCLIPSARPSGRILPGAMPTAGGEYLTPAELAARPYAGVHVSGLCDPRVTVRQLAREWVMARRHADGGQAFLNTRIGEPAAPARARITIADLERCIARGALQRRPEELVTAPVPGEDVAGAVVGGGGESLASGARLVVVGIDVQAPKDAPTFYTRVKAIAGGGREYSLHFGRIGGAQSWDALAAWIERLEVPVRDGRGEVCGVTGVDMIGIDSGYETRAVLDWSRRALYSRATSRRVLIVPVRFTARLTADSPYMAAPEAKQINPERPELGLLPHYYAHRHTWVDRELAAWTGERVTALHALTPEMLAHLRSQVLQPVKGQHGQEATREEWQVAKGVKDDWLMAGCYATLAAAISGWLGRIGSAPPLARRVGGGGQAAGGRPEAAGRRRPAGGTREDDGFGFLLDTAREW